MNRRTLVLLGFTATLTVSGAGRLNGQPLPPLSSVASVRPASGAEDGPPKTKIGEPSRTASPSRTLQDITAARKLIRDTVLVRGGKAAALVLHPDSDAGRAAAAAVVAAVKEQTGIELPARVATERDRQPAGTVILLGNVDSNPALLLFYARYLTPVDSVCPGAGGSLVHTVFDPFGAGCNAIVLGAADATGLAQAAGAFCGEVARRPKGGDLSLPRLFLRQYGKDFLDSIPWADRDSDPKRLERGLAAGRRALDEGAHTSIAGRLADVAGRYELTGDSVQAQLFVKLWDLYVESAIADPRKYGGPWGFDSDFPSAQVVAGWEVIEHDPQLSDDDRLRVTKAMARWLAEAVIPKAASKTSRRVPHNHQTFPGLGALFAGLYFTQAYGAREGYEWLDIADTMFQRQAGYFKPYEDCNGYQWLTNGHLMRYCLARPDFTLFTNGNGRRIIDYCMGVMNNLGYQTPYGDTGSWECWNSEMICLDMFAFATGDPGAAWAANRKREIKHTRDLYAFYRTDAGVKPTSYDGVRCWPLEPHYYESHTAAIRPPVDRCFDKVSFREAMDPQAAYLLLDGLSNGGHKHLDGNAVLQLTQFNRIWLADNDYFKAPVKYHNSMMVFHDGESGEIPEYVELLAAGESPRCGYSRTRLGGYAGVDWERTVVWLKPLKAFVVLDRLVASQAGEHQFRVLWHGIGAAEITDQGLLLSQKGPSLWIQPAPGPRLTLVNDEELGKNWEGYPHAEPVVRSLSATATVRLGGGEAYLFATALHGEPDGIAKPWRLDWIAGRDGVALETDQGRVNILLGPVKTQGPNGSFSTDAGVVVAASDGVSLLGATAAETNGAKLHASATAAAVDVLKPAASFGLAQLARREPTPNLSVGGQAPTHPVLWRQRPLPEPLTGSPPSTEGRPAAEADNSAKLFHFTRVVAGRLDGAGPEILAATKEGTLFAFRTDGGRLWARDFPTQLNDVATADLNGDGKDEILLARQDHRVAVLDSDGKEMWSRELKYYRRPPYVNLVRAGDLDGDGKPEIIAGGENWRFYAFKADGAELWNYESVHPSRSGSVADLDGDGKCEVVCGTHYYWMTALNPDGTKRWGYNMGPICYDTATGAFDGDTTRGVLFGGGDGCLHYTDSSGKARLKYNTGDEVKQVAACDLDGDGRDEIVAGSMSHSVYCFGADAKRRWRVDLGAPVSSLAAVTGPAGRCILAGSTSGKLVTVDAKGNVLAASDLAAAVIEIAPHAEAAVVATADGVLRRVRLAP